MLEEKEVRSLPHTDPWEAQVWRGFRIAGFMVLYFVTGLLLFKGGLNIRGGPDTSVGVGLAEVGVGTGVLIATANIWLRWLSAVMLIGALKALLSIPMGTAITNPAIRISPLQGLELALLFLAVSVLSVRFLSAKPNGVDKASAIILVYSFLWGGLFDGGLIYFVPGVLAMSASWLWYRWGAGSRRVAHLSGRNEP